MTDPDCKECDGEGFITIGNDPSADDGVRDIACPTCYPDGLENNGGEE